MHPRPRALAVMIAIASALALAVPAVAGAATFTVNAGQFDRSIEAQGYYPQLQIVKPGDKVAFRMDGFHTVTFVPPGRREPALIVPAGGQAPATNDPAGNPYWWGGNVPLLGINPTVPGPSPSLAVTGRRIVNSGFPGPRPAVFTFPTAGTFRYFCVVHPRMRGAVRVLPATARRPDPAIARARAARELANDRRAAANARRVAAARPATSPTVLVGRGTPRFNVLEFFPSNATVAVGSSLTFRWAGRSEVHTVSFGPEAYLTAAARRFAAPGPALDSEVAYPSDPPIAGIPEVTPTSHGNGFVNSGLLTDPGVGPPPHSFTVRFPTAGTFNYMCLVHPEMKGTVTVQ